MSEADNSTGDNAKEPRKASFLAELKRRKVFRVAATYAVVSWIIIQVASATFTGFGIPDWAFRFVVLMVLLGFPVAIILAWAFELTPEGVRKAAIPQSMVNSEESTGFNRKRNWYTIGMAALLPSLIFGTLAVFFYITRSPEPDDLVEIAASETDTYEVGTVAVLPFALFSEDQDLRTTADGIQDEMLTVLSEMDPLNVVSRTSTLQFSSASQSIPEIGKILDADFIVEGSMQAVGERISITIQLIHAADDQHIWAQSFDHSPEFPDEPIVLQKEIAFELSIRIYEALETAYPPVGIIKERRDKLLNDLETAMRADFEAFWINWKGEGWDKEFASLLKQIDHIIQLDPDNAIAYDSSAAVKWMTPEVGLSDPFGPEWIKESYLFLKRSYAVAPDGFDTNKHLGIYYYLNQNLPHKALPFSRRAVELEREMRGTVDVYTYWSLLDALCATGQSAAAMQIAEEAVESGLANFSGPAWFWTQGHRMLGNFQKELDFYRMSLEGAIASGNEMSSLFYPFKIALAEAEWMGSKTPLRAFLDQNPDISGFPLHTILFTLEDYPGLLEGLSKDAANFGLSSILPVDLALVSGWAYKRMGNHALANSYFKGFLNEMQTSTKGQWMATYAPDMYAALHAYGHACIGDREEALKSSAAALQHADPSQQFESYFDTMFWLSVSYTVLGEEERACEFIDLMLSSPSQYKAGQIMITALLADLKSSPFFEKVIRKHADQLKDPGVLDAYFQEN